MSTIHLHQTTTATPEQFLDALTDFGPEREAVFSNSADDYLKVHELGTTNADVTEGSGGAWERLHYDWTDPHHVVMATTDSNLWGGNSGHTYTLTPTARRNHRHRRRRGPRRQESQRTSARGRARRLRHPRPGKGVRQDRHGHRSAQRHPADSEQPLNPTAAPSPCPKVRSSGEPGCGRDGPPSRY